MNSYSDVTTIKSPSYLDIDRTSDDENLRKILEEASREFDKLTDRFFYAWEGTRYYPGTGYNIRFQDDILSITTFKTDEDGDGTFENTLDTTDYFLYPLNDLPKIRAKINHNGNYGSFGANQPRGVEITGVFGYGDGYTATPYIDSGDTLEDNSMTTTKTTFEVNDGTKFAIGQTLRCNDEQVYITAISTNNLTVTRAVNGTTAAAHANKSTLYIYQYPEPVREATLIIAMRRWKRKDSAYQDVVGSLETGQIITSKGQDADVKEIRSQYRRVRL